MLSMEVKGLADLDKALAKLGAQAGNKALVAALKDAAKPVHNHMVANAPESSGVLKSGIKMRSKKAKGKTSAKVTVGTKKADFHAAIAAEFGTKKQVADPFIRAALDSKWRESLAIFQAALKSRIEKQAKKLAKLSGK